MPADPAPPTPMAQRLREGTWAMHGQAERAGIMPALLRGQLARPVLARLQRNLLALYAVLEPGLQQHAQAQPALAPWADAELARSPALAQDLQYLHGDDWADLPLEPATQTYVARLTALARSAPLLLAAHAYVRYLGDLNGGQALARIVRRGQGLSSADGTRFFDFGPAAQVSRLATGCRTALTLLPAALGEALVAEAQWAFRQHVLLFEQLAQPAPAGG